MVAKPVQPRKGAFKIDHDASVAIPAQNFSATNGNPPSLACDTGSNGGAGTCPCHGPEFPAALKHLHEALRAAVESERDLAGMPNAADPAVDAWITAAEAARGTVRDLAMLILRSFGGGCALTVAARCVAKLTLDLLAAESPCQLRKPLAELHDLESTARFGHILLESTARFGHILPQEMWGDIAEAAAELHVYVDLDTPPEHGPDDWPHGGEAAAL